MSTQESQPENRFRVWPLSRLDFGLLVTLALCLFALWPLTQNPGLPNGYDVMYHAFRAAEMDRSWSHGVLMPRWAEGMYYGYGSPLFQFYAGSTYYLTSLLARVFGFGSLDSLRAVIVLAVLGSGAGMYLFARPRAGKLGGIIAGVVYAYSPYLLYTESYARGDYPELLALALAPWVMWRFERLLASGHGRDALLAAISLALLIITHNLMALVFFGLLVAWLGWHLVIEMVIYRGKSGDPDHGRSVPHPYGRYGVAFVAAGLGVGLAGYFWLPVLLESGEVRLENLTAIALLDYRNFFVSMRDLLAFAPRTDASALNGLQPTYSLGVAQWLLALTGFASAMIVGAQRAAPLRGIISDRRIRQALFFALVGVVLVFLMLPASSAIWDGIDALSMLQFPWRWLGPAAFCLAVLAGMNAAWIEKLPASWGGIAAAGVVIAPVALALPMLFVPSWDHKALDTSISAYQNTEVQGLQRGTTFTNEYLPRSAVVLADATSWLLADYADGYPINKANRASIPAGATVELLDNGPQHSTWRVTAQTPFTLEVLIFDFAGWTATINGEKVPITPSDPHGFITFPVPAGEHTVRVYLGSTPVHDLGYLVTIVSALGLLALIRLLQIRRRGGSHLTPRPPLQSDEGETKSRIIGMKRAWRVGLLAGVVINAALVVVFMRPGGAFVDSPPGEVLLAEHHVTYTLSDGEQDLLRLIGYDLSADTFNPGDRLRLVVYWQVLQPLPYDYQSFVHVSTGGPPPAQADKENPTGFPTSRWSTGGHYEDEYLIDLPETLLPGEYNLVIGLYTCETLPAGECGNGDRLIAADAEGNVMGDTMLLQTITVR